MIKVQAEKRQWFWIKISYICSCFNSLCSLFKKRKGERRNNKERKKWVDDLQKLLDYGKIKNTVIETTSTYSKVSRKQAPVATKYPESGFSYLELLPILLYSIIQPMPLTACFQRWLRLQGNPNILHMSWLLLYKNPRKA